MFIDVQDTPNPNTLKFILQDNILSETTTYHFINKDEAVNSPLALELFEFAEVKNVFLGSNFVSVMVYNQEDWVYLKANVLSVITDFVANGKIIINQVDNDETSLGSAKVIGKNAEEQEIIDKIHELFEERIRPAVAMDGGDIIFRSYNDGTVYLSMYGSCAGCPSSDITLKNGIENMLKYYIPEVQTIETID